MQEFLAEAIKSQNKKIDNSFDDYTQDKYTKEQKVYIEQQNVYPTFRFDFGEPKNKNDQATQSAFNIRQKLCLKILLREQTTDYFLTVYSRQNLGNEKVYERRINTGPLQIDMKKMELQQNGDFLYTSFYLNKKSIEQQKKNGGYNEKLPIQLIFPLKALYKDPLLLDPKGNYIGFYGEKSFYEYREIQLTLAQNKIKDVTRIIEYDLHNFSKVKAIDYNPQDFDLNEYQMENFGKFREGFYRFQRKEDSSSKEKVWKYILHRNKEECQLGIQTINLEDENGKKQLCRFSMNEKGDRVLGIYSLKGEVKVNRFILGIKQGPKGPQKHFKIDPTIDFKPMAAFINKDFKGMDMDFKITCLSTGDFLVAIRKGVDKEDQVNLYLNEQLIFETKNAKIEELYYSNIQIDGNQKKLQIIRVQKKLNGLGDPSNEENLIEESDYYDNFEYDYVSLLYPPNQFTIKQDWSREAFETVNREVVICHPYMFFLYNHDQVYMKDLRFSGKQGYYYMNNFCGIDKISRPLMIQCYQNRNTLCLNIPIISRKYKSNDFKINLVQFQTNAQMSDSLTFQNSYMEFSILQFNQNILNVMQKWARIITNSEGNLDKDVRIKSKGQSISVEKWDQNKCIQRVLISQYNSLINKEDRNISNIRQNRSPSLDFSQEAFRIMIFQDKEGFRVFTYNQEFFFYLFDFTNPSELENIFEYVDEEASNPIFDIMIDTLIPNEVNIYALLQNGVMKKFSAKIPSESEKATNLEFIENKLPFLIDRVFNDETQKTKKKTDLTKTDALLTKYFVANDIFYSTISTPIDLRAERLTLDGRAILGQNIPSPFQPSSKQFIGYYSEGDGRVAYSSEDQELNFEQIENNPLIEKLNFMPQINSRTIPTFHHARFVHPIVPLVDIENGYTSVFTLNLANLPNQKIIEQYYDIENYYLPKNLMNHSTSKYLRFQKFKNLSPGILIKYFNGVEDKLSLKDKFLEVERLVISKDGFNIVIQGKKVDGDQIVDGYFLYQIEKNNHRIINLKQIIPFAQFKSQNQKIQLIFETSEIENDVDIGKYLEDEENEIDDLFIPQIDQDQKYLNDQDIDNALEVEQSEDEDDAIAPPNQDIKKPKRLLSSNQQSFQLNKNQETIKPIQLLKFRNINVKFQGFDLPSMSFDIPSLLNYGKKEDFKYSSNLSFKGDNQKIIQVNSFEKLNDKDQARLQKIHDNLHIQVNENGEIFITNRASNKLYYFFSDYSGKFQCKKIVCQEFKILGADSDGNKLLIWGKDQYMVLDFSYLKDGSIVNIQDNELINYDQTRKLTRMRIMDNFILNKLQTSEDKKRQDTIDRQRDSFNQEILDCRIVQNNIIYQVQETLDSQTVNYLKIFDYEKNVLLNYFEYDQLLLSGDKRYMWLPLKNRVYDLNENLSTLFLWNEGQINLCGYDHMDIFSVSQDVSIMATHSMLNLAFDFISACLQDNILNQDIIEDDAGEIDENEDEDQQEEENENQEEELKEKEELTIKRSKSMKIDDNVNQVKNLENERIDLQKKIQTKIDPEGGDFKNRLKYIFYSLPYGQSILKDILTIKINENSKSDKLDKVEKGKLEEKYQDAKEQQLQVLINYFRRRMNDGPDTIINIADYLLSTKIIVRDPKKNDQLQRGILVNIFGSLINQENGRQDIIEDILAFFVENLRTPIAQNIINEYFLEFLTMADTSQAFQKYMDSSLLKTVKMEQTLKYQILRNEDTGLTLGSYNSPIMDDKFHEQFLEPNVPKVDVQISYINLGNLLETKGEAIMKVLSEQRMVNIMSNPFINHLVQFQWDRVKGDIRILSLYPFYLLLAFFTYYTLWLVEYQDGADKQSPHTNDKEEPGYIKMLTYFVTIIMQLVVIAYFLYQEFKQFMDDYKYYFTSVWNWQDIISYTMCLLVIFYDLSATDTKKVLRPLASITLIVLWIKMFYFLRSYDQTSKLIRMIIEIIVDMKYFMFVLMIAIISFAGGFYIMQEGLLSNKDVKPEDAYFAGTNPFMAVIYTYRMAMGDFSLDQLSNFDNNFEIYFMWSVFLIGSFFLVIVLLNLLIAIMGATFEEVSSSIINLQIREKALLVSENESLFDRSAIFKRSQYLIIIKEGKAGASEAATVENQINLMKQDLIDRVAVLESQLNSQMADTQRDLKRKFIDQEEKQKMGFSETDSKSQALQEELKKTINELSKAVGQVKNEIEMVKSQGSSMNEKVEAIETLQATVQGLKSEQQTLKLNIYKKFDIKEE